MNSSFLKKMMVLALTGLFLVSTGANAACPKGTVKDTTTGKCVKAPPK